MSFSNETQEIIKQFAKVQSQYYLDAAEMTYIEKLRRKTGQTKRKIGAKLSRFKGSSNQAIEARNDMVLFMNDYMSDLMSKGFSEQQALEKAKEELSASGDSGLQNDLQERFQKYYDTAAVEATGLLYGGFMSVGIVVGAITGYIISGGQQEFLNGGWIDTLVGTGAGALLGIGLGEIGHAIITMKKR